MLFCTYILTQIPSFAYWITIFVILFLIIVLAYFYLEWKTWSLQKMEEYLEKIIRHRTSVLVKEKTQIEGLLINLLPRETAEELKTTNRVVPRLYQVVTILFADIQGFTKISKEISPEELIRILDEIFFHFDKIVEKYNIEKIKTIGDSYMCAGGVPRKNTTNPVEVTAAALEMQYVMNELNVRRNIQWKLRIGIHTGPVIAGVIGSKKLTYDIWGDSVNTASRMETYGEAGKVNVSGTTCRVIEDFFDCEYREKIPVKNIGPVEMYFVNGFKKEFAGRHNHEPNERFLIKLQLLRLNDMQEEVYSKLQNELPAYITYSNWQHTIDVQNYCEALGKYEKLSDEQMLVLKTAALLHDTGYIWDGEAHTRRSAEFASQLMNKYHYSQKHIQQVCDLINATENPYKPSGLLEQIICDADQSYLLKKNVEEYILNKYKQLKALKKIKSEKKWYREEAEKVLSPKFFTIYIYNFDELSKEERRGIYEKIIQQCK